MATIDQNGLEVLDQRPVAAPVNIYARRSTLSDLQQMYRLAAQIAADTGAETAEEADDFDVGDDFDPSVPFESLAGHLDEDAFQQALAESVRNGTPPLAGPDATADAELSQKTESSGTPPASD